MGWNLAAASPHETLEENADLGFAGGTAQVTSSVSLAGVTAMATTLPGAAASGEVAAARSSWGCGADM
jgi:hypothetical protein